MNGFTKRAAPAVVGLFAAATLAACSSSSSPSSSSSTPASSAGTFDTASAATAVKQTWTSFFSKTTPVAEKEALVENGSTMAAAMQAFASSPMTSEVSASVQNVTFPSPTKADVTYSISLNGQVVENAMAGNAVYQGGKWLVADTTLCGLLQLAQSQGGSSAAIPGCG
ncbi:MAG TPA: hypothetical protein VFN97_21055 [Actinospica sp.]|nr:hypothetical protein [Actinospica sp.]